MPMDVSKTRSSFYRRLYVAWLIDSGTATNVPALMDATGMPLAHRAGHPERLDRAGYRLCFPAGKRRT